MNKLEKLPKHIIDFVAYANALVGLGFQPEQVLGEEKYEEVWGLMDKIYPQNAKNADTVFNNCIEEIKNNFKSLANEILEKETESEK